MHATTDLLDKLKAISDENRFTLLSSLNKPKTINQIDLTATSDTKNYRKDRPLTRQGIHYHLDFLRDADLVTATLENREGRLMNVHQINPCGVFLFLEQLDDHLGELASQAPPVETDTLDLDGPTPQHWPTEPRLIVVHGLPPGDAFSLSGKPPSADRGWIVGRSPKAEIPIPYDPYVAVEQSEIMPTEEGYRVLDLRSSKNRTYLNGEPIGRGDEARLERGDLIRVGRSQLLYQGP